MGSHTSVALIEAGFEVVVVDNFCNSKRYILDRIEQITGKSVRFYEVDVCDENVLMRSFLMQEDIESVIHFAALKSVGESVEFPEKYIKNNIGGTEVLLKSNVSSWGEKVGIFFKLHSIRSAGNNSR